MIQQSDRRVVIGWADARQLIAATVAALMLLLAVAPWSYNYYQILRLAVCAAAIYIFYEARADRARRWLLSPLVLVAVLFNPIVPLSCKRETWQVLDIASASFFLASIITIRRTP